MRNKFIKDFAIVIVAYFWGSSLVSRLLGIAVYSVLPGDLITAVAISVVAFVLAYVGAWLFFNKWQAKPWIKVCIAVGIIIVSHVIFLLVDRSIVMNMMHPN